MKKVLVLAVAVVAVAGWMANTSSAHQGVSCAGCHVPHNAGTADLAASHPVSFIFDTNLAVRANGGLKDPGTATSGLGGTIKADLLDANDKMQCTSCHDVHQTAFSNALRWQYDTGAAGNTFCRTCHNK